MSSFEIKTLDFSLSDKEKILSKEIYKGKLLRFLIVPFHSFAVTDAIFTGIPRVTVFPERNLSMFETASYVNDIVEDKNFFTSELLIITSNMSIIKDAIASCSRVVDYEGNLHGCTGIEGFGLQCNIHTIDIGIFSEFSSPKSEIYSKKKINDIITIINTATSFSPSEQTKLETQIKNIGEDILKSKLLEMLRDKGSLLGNSSFSKQFIADLDVYLTKKFHKDKRREAETLFLNLAEVSGEQEIYNNYINKP